MANPATTVAFQGYRIFNCCLCYERDITELNPKVIYGSTVCRPCVKDLVIPKFHAAFLHEYDYPVRWTDNLVLNAIDFVTELGMPFVVRFQRLEQEYLAPPGERVYCKNRILAEHRLSRGTTLASNVSSPAFENPEAVNSAQKQGKKVVECGVLLCVGRRPCNNDTLFLNAYCQSCGGCACPTCGEPLYAGDRGASNRPRHICLWQPPKKPEEVLQGLERGKDYQICPRHKCGEVVQLRDGCNFVRCPRPACNAGMCFVCGEGPMEEFRNGHWDNGRPCPRFGQPGEGNPFYGFDRAEDNQVEEEQGEEVFERGVFEWLERLEREAAAEREQMARPIEEVEEAEVPGPAARLGTPIIAGEEEHPAGPNEPRPVEGRKAARREAQDAVIEREQIIREIEDSLRENERLVAERERLELAAQGLLEDNVDLRAEMEVLQRENQELHALQARMLEDLTLAVRGLEAME